MNRPEFAQLLKITHSHPAIRLLPVVDRLLARSILLAHLPGWLATLSLLQGIHDLLHRESLSAHPTSFSEIDPKDPVVQLSGEGQGNASFSSEVHRFRIVVNLRVV